jgi:tRNA C32,U32 (ribose-2'-O)-methylase TrmJ
MNAQLETALLNIGFLQPQNVGHMMLRLRQLFGRAGLEIPDVDILRGIAHQIDWRANSGRK